MRPDARDEPAHAGASRPVFPIPAACNPCSARRSGVGWAPSRTSLAPRHDAFAPARPAHPLRTATGTSARSEDWTTHRVSARAFPRGTSPFDPRRLHRMQDPRRPSARKEAVKATVSWVIVSTSAISPSAPPGDHPGRVRRRRARFARSPCRPIARPGSPAASRS